MSLSCFCHPIPQFTNSIDGYFDSITRMQGANTSRSSCHNPIRDFQSHDRRNEGDQLVYVKDHISCRGHLSHLTIYMAGDHCICRIKFGIDPRTKWAESIKSFATRPLVVLTLKITGSDIIPNCITVDITRCFGGLNPATTFTNHQRQSSFVIDLLGLWRKEDGLVWPDHR